MGHLITHCKSVAVSIWRNSLKYPCLMSSGCEEMAAVPSIHKIVWDLLLVLWWMLPNLFHVQNSKSVVLSIDSTDI